MGKFHLLLFALTMLFTSSAFADLSPPPGERPIIVQVGTFIADVDSIDTAGQGFEARVFYELRWHDPRLKHNNKQPIVKKITEIWSPNVQILNQQRAWSKSGNNVRILPSGDVIYLQTIWASFSQPLDLHAFPFDSQKFNLQFLSIGASTLNLIKLVPDKTGRSGIADKLSITDWSVVNWSYDTTNYEHKDVIQVPMITYSFEANRLTSYFIVKMIIPLIMIVMMSWAVFWMDPTNVASNVSISITSMLTLIAFRFSADSLLPLLSYLTRLDYFILASSILVFFSLIQNLTTSSLAKKGCLNKSYKLDKACRFVFPLVFVLIILETLVYGVVM